MMKNPFLPKLVGWILLAVIALTDAMLDVMRGREGNPLWRPVLGMIGIKNAPFLVPIILLLLYFVVRLGGWLIEKFDKSPNGEDIVLTALVIVYGVFDLWMVAVDFLNFRLIIDYRLMVIPLTIIAIAYASWAEHVVKQGVVNRK